LKLLSKWTPDNPLPPRTVQVMTTRSSRDFMDINSAGTIANLRHEGRFEINSVDFRRRSGYRLGPSRTVDAKADPAHGWMAEWLLLTRPRSPAYTVLDAEEDALLETWSKDYGMSTIRDESENV